jgi:hypothetical protein
MASFVAPTGFVEVDDFNLDQRKTRSREMIDPNTDLSFYFDTYLVPKYGLNNINVNNVASFMKDLEMNWTKIDPEMKPKVLDIMVDGILSKNTSFKNDLLMKLNEKNPIEPTEVPKVIESKSSFGVTGNTNFQIGLGIIVLGIIFILISKMRTPVGMRTRFI